MIEPTSSAATVLSIRRTFNAPRERVFTAFTDPALIASWFGPPDSRVHEVTFDARNGGRYRIEMSMDGGEPFAVGGVISEYHPPETLAYTFRWEEDDPQDERDTYVRLEFADRGTQCEMTLTQTGFIDDESRNRHEFGWNASLEKLSGLI